MHVPPEKNRNLRSSNCWKYIQIVNPTTITLVLYHFKSFTIPSGGPFWLLGGWGAPRAPPPRLPTGLFLVMKKVIEEEWRKIIREYTV